MNTLIYLHIVISIISRAYMETEEIIFVINRISCVVEQFSMSTESNPGFYLFLLYFVSTVIVPPSQPIRLKTETNRVMATCVFPRFRRLAYFEFSLVSPSYDWLLRLLWFWFYDTQSHSALLSAI